MEVTDRDADPRCEAAADLLALPLAAARPAHWRLPARLAALDRALGGRLAQAVAAGDFKGKRGETLLLYPPTRAAREARAARRPRRRSASSTPRRCARRGAARRREAAAPRGARVARPASPSCAACAPPALRAGARRGRRARGYRFDRYRSNGEGRRARGRSSRSLLERGAGRCARRARGARDGRVLAECQNLARDLSNEPPNALPPAALAREAEQVAAAGRPALPRARRAPSSEARARWARSSRSAQGSANPPRVIVLEHGAPPRGAQATRGGAARPSAWSARASRFDSGGLSIKPTAEHGRR